VLIVALVLVCALPLPARAAAPDAALWLHLATPEAGARELGPIGLVEVNGRAGRGDEAAHDLVLAIDVSGSTATASGSDIDGDGRVGRRSRLADDDWRSFNPRRLSSDEGDTVLAAELAGARRLLETLDPRTRVGIVTFAGDARPVADLASTRAAAQAALDELGDAFGSGSTNMADGLALALELLEVAPSDDTPRQRSIAILSDGYPTEPSPEAAAELTLAAARRAAERGVRIHPFALGVPAGPLDVFERVAEVGRGRLVRLAKAAEIVDALPRVELSDVVGISVENRTSGAAARAVRLFSDGSFDGFVSLVPGENTLVVTARGSQGEDVREERTVHFERREPADAAEAARFEDRLEQLRKSLRDRTVETELVSAIEAQRRTTVGGQGLEVHVEPSAAEPERR
jgi:Mg-chelatase subunit ChlD